MKIQLEWETLQTKDYEKYFIWVFVGVLLFLSAMQGMWLYFAIIIISTTVVVVLNTLRTRK